MERFAAVLAAVAYLSGDPAAKEELATDIALAETTYAGRLGLASALAPSDDPAHWALAEAWLESAEGMIDDTLSKETHARFYYTRAFFAVRRRDVVTARRNFERSVAIFPHPENPAALALLTILENVGDRAAFRKLRQRVFDGVSVPRVQELSRHLRAKKREGREPRK
jgi:hypothetical protein